MVTVLTFSRILSHKENTKTITVTIKLICALTEYLWTTASNYVNYLPDFYKNKQERFLKLIRDFPDGPISQTICVYFPSRKKAKKIISFEAPLTVNWMSSEKVFISSTRPEEIGTNLPCSPYITTCESLKEKSNKIWVLNVPQ